MKTCIQARPKAALIASTSKDEKPESRPDEAEDGYKHHPAQGVVRVDSSRGHQDPHQTPNDPLWEEEQVRKADEDPGTSGQNIT